MKSVCMNLIKQSNDKFEAGSPSMNCPLRKSITGIGCLWMWICMNGVRAGAEEEETRILYCEKIEPVKAMCKTISEEAYLKKLKNKLAPLGSEYLKINALKTFIFSDFGSRHQAALYWIENKIAQNETNNLQKDFLKWLEAKKTILTKIKEKLNEQGRNCLKLDDIDQQLIENIETNEKEKAIETILSVVKTNGERIENEVLNEIKITEGLSDSPEHLSICDDTSQTNEHLDNTLSIVSHQ